MAEKEFLCIKQVVKTVQIPLPATFISNETAGVAEILESWKRQYKKQLQGVVVNYKNISLSSPTGFIAPNKPYVYYNVTATFDLFCPKVGDIVKGKINRTSKEHIGCLIEDTINVTIHLSRDSPQDLSLFIGLNREILFEISNFNYDRKMIRVTGKITPHCIQLMKDLFPPQTFHNSVNTPDLSNNTDEGIGTSSESADDGLQNHTFDDSKINNDDGNFKKPLSNNTKSKKQVFKRPKSDSESSSSTDSSDSSTSDEKPKKKKKHNSEINPDMDNHLSANSLSNTVSSDTLIENFSNFDHDETFKAIKEEVLPFKDDIHIKNHKKKRTQDSSPGLTSESAQLSNQGLNGDVATLDNSTVTKTDKLSKKRKRDSESSFVDTSEQLTADEMPKKKKIHKDNNISLFEKEIKDKLIDLPINGISTADLLSAIKMLKKKKKPKNKTVPIFEEEIRNEFVDMPDDSTDAIMALKREIFSPLKPADIVVPETKKKKKKNKNPKEKKSKKKRGKMLSSGAVLKKDKKSRKKGSKKNKLDGEQSKKHKKGKSHKKDKSEKKKKKDNSKDKKSSDVMKSEID